MRARLRSGSVRASHESRRSPGAGRPRRRRCGPRPSGRYAEAGAGGQPVLLVGVGADEGGAEHHQDGDELRGGERAAEDGAAGGVAAEELDDEARHRVEDHVGERDLAVELLARRDRDQDAEDQQAGQRLVDLRRVQRRVQGRAHHAVGVLVVEGDRPGHLARPARSSSRRRSSRAARRPARWPPRGRARRRSATRRAHGAARTTRPRAARPGARRRRRRRSAPARTARAGCASSAPTRRRAAGAWPPPGRR